MTQQTPSRIRGWTVVLAALGVNLIIGSLYAWSVMGKALAGQWHWTKTQAMLPFATSTAAFAVTMIFAGRWQDKIGPRYVAMLGGIIFGLGLVLSSFVHTYGLMLITFGLVRHWHRAGLLRHHAPLDQVVSARKEGVDYRHRSQRCWAGRCLHVPFDQLLA